MGQKGEIWGEAVGSVVGNSKGGKVVPVCLRVVGGGDLCVFVSACICEGVRLYECVWTPSCGTVRTV